MFEVKMNQPIEEDEIIKEFLEKYDNANSIPAYIIVKLESKFFEATGQELGAYRQELKKLSLQVENVYIRNPSKKRKRIEVTPMNQPVDGVGQTSKDKEKIKEDYVTETKGRWKDNLKKKSSVTFTKPIQLKENAPLKSFTKSIPITRIWLDIDCAQIKKK